MNAVIHAQISVRKRGGTIEDYLPVHEFMDCTKELCSDNRHRILHTMWGIKRVIIPIFGHTIINSVGKIVNVKDLCEQDHILPDYQNRFIPTLADFVTEIDKTACAKFDFKKIATSYAADPVVHELMLSPLANTGMQAALLITHNSWFINTILPKLFNRKMEIRDFDITPADLFNNMQFQLWMDNGNSYPASCRLTANRIIH
ncbi:MAG: hypothetical protein J0I41_23385 [Filimonas sp.]|nr:hypothetical protein [Filimonas sp.]